jgi:hypothetical protein
MSVKNTNYYTLYYDSDAESETSESSLRKENEKEKEKENINKSYSLLDYLKCIMIIFTRDPSG